MFPVSITGFSDLFGSVVTLLTTLEADYILAAMAVVGLGGWAVRLVKRSAR